MSAAPSSIVLGRVGRGGLLSFLVLFLTGPLFAQAHPTAGAYGERLDLRLLPLLGGGVRVASGPLPEVAGPPLPAPGETETVASVQVALGRAGTVLKANVLTAHTEAAGTGDGANAEARVTDLAVDLTPLVRLLRIGADAIESKAGIAGTCGGPLTTAGTTTLANARASGPLGLGLHLDARPAPNTVLLNLLGLRVVLNEQIVGGDGVTGRSIAVNAIHISLNNALLTGLGLLSGDIVIAHSEAALACDPVIEIEDADLGLTLTAAPEPVFVDDTLTYTLTVRNLGPAAAEDAELTVDLPAGADLLSATPSQGSCGGTLGCFLGNLAVGAAATVTIQVVPHQVGTLVATAGVSSPTPDPELANNTAAVTTTVQERPEPGADLQIEKAGPETVFVGDELVYVITVTNLGPDPAPEVAVTDFLPARLSMRSVSTSVGTCGEASDPLFCELGTLPAGASAVITLVTATGDRPGEVVNEASVTSALVDPDDSNNQSAASTAIERP